MAVNVLFVCLGNICRSPTAHGVFEHRVNQRQLDNDIIVDSAGTGDWHIGHSPDSRATAAAAKHGYDLTALRARQVARKDFKHFDYVLAMDGSNLSDLQKICPPDYPGQLKLFLSFGESKESNVPDPFYGEAFMFDHVLSLIESASDGLLEYIVQQHKL